MKQDRYLKTNTGYWKTGDWKIGARKIGGRKTGYWKTGQVMVKQNWYQEMGTGA